MRKSESTYDVYGFSLIELMIVVAIIAFLSMIAMPSFMRYLAKAKRVEAYLNLGSLYTAEKIYWAEHGSFTDRLNGSNSVGWKPEGYSGGGKQEQFHYSYGFCQGKEGEHYFTGKLGAHLPEINNSNIDKQSFVAIAAADIDGDGKLDIIAINEKREIMILQDDLID